VTAKYTRVTEVSTRSPRSSWNQPRPLVDVLGVLERNGFLRAQSDTGVSLVRVCGQLAIRVTVANGKALLETALRSDGEAVRWRPSRDRIGTEPWRVGREALELLATIDVDTPVRWG
jgi:hypothetical protein